MRRRLSLDGRGRLATLARSRPPEGTGGLLAATLLLSVGKGTFLATVMVYLLEIVQLETVTATAALSLWGAASVAVAYPVGMLIDRALGRRTGAVSAVCTAALLPVVTQVDTVWLLVVMFVAGGCDSAGNVVRRACFAGSGDAVTALAWARTVTNVGFALGGLLAVWLLSAHSAWAYALAYLLISGVYLVMAAAFLTTSLGVGTRRPAPAQSPSPAESPAESPADAAAEAEHRRPRSRRPGVLLALATSILTLHSTLLTTVLPLWITNHTSVPVAAVGWLVMLNTLITVCGQIPVSKLAATTEGAVRCFRSSALWIAACCVLLGLVGRTPLWAQVGLLVTATIALTCGELFEAAGEWGLSATLAADGEHGFYQSSCVVGEASQSAVGPLLVGTMVTALPVLGWVVLIGVLGLGRSLAGSLAPPARAAAPQPATFAGPGH